MAMLPPDPVYIFRKDMESVSCLAVKISAYNELIYAGTHDGVIHVWNSKNMKEWGSFKIGDNSCLAICVCEDLVIAQDKIGVISFWRENKTQWTFLKQIETDFFGFCKFYLFEGVLYSVLKNNKCQKISIKTLESIKLLNFEEDNKLGEIMALKVMELNHRRVVLVAYEGNQLIFWDEEEAKKISGLVLEDCPMAFDFDVCSRKGICGSPTDKMVVFSVDANFNFRIENSIKLVNYGVACVQIRPDCKLVAVGCWDGKIRLYSWKSLILLAALDVHSSTVQDVCFYKTLIDRKTKYLLIAGSLDSKISLWDLYNYKN